MAHNSVLTLAAVPFDVFVTFVEAMVAGEKDRTQAFACGIAVGRKVMLSFKFHEMVVTMLWVAFDLNEVISEAPGSGSLKLAYIAITSSILIILMELVVWGMRYSGKLEP